MGLYRVISRHYGAVEVRAANWLSALGEGLQRLGAATTMDRMAAEVLGNGQILVRDIRNGHGFIVLTVEESNGRADQEPPADEPVGEEADAPTPIDGLLEGVEAVLDAPDVQAASERALKVVMEAVPAESGSVLLLNDANRLVFFAVAGPSADKLLGISLPADAGIVGFCVKHGASLMLRDAYADRRFYKGMDQQTGYKTEAVLCVPVALEKRVYGCVEVLNPMHGGGFDRDALQEVELLANALAERIAAGAATGW